ncbi:MAG: alpha/beta fold hydrolase [Chloroflexota bacterium]
MRPETRYARSGDVSIAYQVLGEGPLDLVLVPGFVSHLEVGWEEPNLAHLLTRLASFSRLILFDKRGSGLSDPVTGVPTMAQRMDDIGTVMDDAGSQRAAILGISEGGTLGMSFAVHHPQRVMALVIYGSWARRMRGPDYPWGPTEEELDKLLARMDEAWATGRWWDGDEPTRFDTPRHQAWWARYLRTAASPAMAQRLVRMNARLDIRALLSSIRARTLILHRVDDRWIEIGHARYLADHIPAATFMELPGADHRPWLGDVDAIVDAVEQFLVGRRHRPRRSARVGPDALSRREREVAMLAARGETAGEIAERLSISERTVETHLTGIYSKLDVRSKSDLIRRAAEFDL